MTEDWRLSVTNLQEAPDETPLLTRSQQMQQKHRQWEQMTSCRSSRLRCLQMGKLWIIRPAMEQTTSYHPSWIMKQIEINKCQEPLSLQWSTAKCRTACKETTQTSWPEAILNSTWEGSITILCLSMSSKCHSQAVSSHMAWTSLKRCRAWKSARLGKATQARQTITMKRHPSMTRCSSLTSKTSSAPSRSRMASLSDLWTTSTRIRTLSFSITIR